MAEIPNISLKAKPENQEAMIKERKITIPPIRGIGFSWIFRWPG
ncbi:MAG: hypothetical protein ABIC39_06140 [Pseudomonadota bacterium]